MSWTLKELASIAGGSAAQSPSSNITGFRAVEDAAEGDLTFVTGARWLKRLKPGVAAVVPGELEREAGDRPLIVADNPRLAFVKILEAVYPPHRPAPGIDRRAVVEESASLGKDVYVGPMAYVGSNAKIGDRSVIHPGAHLSENAQTGKDCVLHPHCYIGPGCRLGDRVIIGPGASIGHDGFGYQWDGVRHVKAPQVGIAVIEDDVEIGALSAVDKAMLGETRIGAGTKIDNLVMVGHNCKIGQNVILVAQTGLSGSVSIGDNSVLGGQAGIADGISIGRHVMIAAQSGVGKNIPDGAKIGGTLAREIKQWMRNQAALNKLPDLMKKIKLLEKKIDMLERKTGGEKGKSAQ